ncbi:MAG: sialate O-acetylesterase [Phycisphaera sp.]|nr:sialate O-acetylesterase [Phycisphaera sp.]
MPHTTLSPSARSTTPRAARACVSLLTALLLTALAAPAAHADVALPVIFNSHMVIQRDKPVNVWGRADKGEQVTVTFDGQTASATAGDDGKWALQLKPMKANATPQSLTIKGNNTLELTDVLIGEVWLCSGQSNMEFRMTQTMHAKEQISAADHPDIRLFDVPKHISSKTPQETAPGAWAVCTPDTVKNFTAVGYHFGRELKDALRVPIGLVGSNWGGTQIEPWTPAVGLEQVDSLKDNATNGGIYNGMIHPLAPMTFRGILWYQGESNCLKGDTGIYTDRTLALVKGWRTVFQQDDLPFYFVQIAPFTYSVAFKKRNDKLTPESLPLFWEAQAACLTKVPNCGMVVITDITGNVNNIHPTDKIDVGHRLALWALAKTYGKSDLVYSGPMYKSMKVEGDKIVLTFDHTGSGLKSLDDQPLTYFTIAGADKQFVEATAMIKGDTIEVSSDKVKTPTAVRFAWTETAVPNLANKDGLPAVPFRTDNW